MTKKNISKSILYIGWILAFLLLWLRGCESDKIENKTRVLIPEIKGSFDPVKDIEYKEIDTIYLKVSKSTGLEKYQNDISTLYNENEVLKQAYINETDSLKRELMYFKSIQLKEFMHEFDNDTINILVKGIVQGEVKSLQPFYTIKQKNSPEVKFRFLGGFGVGNSINFDKPVFNAGFGFQNAKGNILRIGFDTENRINVNYDFNIFTIKK